MLLARSAHSLEVGKAADLVLLQARDPVELIKLSATRLQVVRHGKEIAQSAQNTATLSLAGRPGSVAWAIQR